MPIASNEHMQKTLTREILANLIDLVFNLNNIQVILQTLFITSIKKDYYEGINNGGPAMRRIVYAIKSHFKIYEKNCCIF